MGLDIYFEKRKVEYLELSYFRKVNFLVKYFLDLGYDVENLKDVVICKEDIEELLNRCCKVLENNDLASELLPTTEGFFFGSTNYDDYYFKDVEDVRTTCIDLLEEFESLDAHEEIIFKIWY